MDVLSVLAVTGVLLAAVLAVAGGVGALLTQKVVVDQAGHVTEVDIPLLGRFRSNYPSIGAIALGLLLAFGVLYKITLKPDMIPITAKVLFDHPDRDKSAQVFVGVIPQEYHVVRNNVRSGIPEDIQVMVRKGSNYHVVVYTPIGVDEKGNTRRAIDDGSAKTNGDFEAHLRVGK